MGWRALRRAAWLCAGVLVGSGWAPGRALAPYFVQGRAEAVNGTGAAPVLVAVGPPVVESDSPELLTRPGITYADELRGRARVFDYHTVGGVRPLYVGWAVTNPNRKTAWLVVTRRGRAVSGAVPWAGQVAMDRFLASRRPYRLRLAPGETAWALQRALPGQTAVAIAELELVGAGGQALPYRLRTAAAAQRPAGEPALPVLPPTTGFVRATFPHDQLVGIWRPAAAPRPQALLLFGLSGPVFGYPGEDLALPGEALAGRDALDRRYPVWSKGPYGATYHLLVRPEVPGALLLQGSPGARAQLIWSAGYPKARAGPDWILSGRRGEVALTLWLPGGAVAPARLVWESAWPPA